MLLSLGADEQAGEHVACRALEIYSIENVNTRQMVAARSLTFETINAHPL